MAETIYLLCAATSLLCAIMLSRGYLETRTRLLLWSSLCFAGLALSNLVLVVDLILYPSLNMAALRGAIALVSMTILLGGLVLDA
jgi:Family of unknown function (DUF5985)